MKPRVASPVASESRLAGRVPSLRTIFTPFAIRNHASARAPRPRSTQAPATVIRDIDVCPDRTISYIASRVTVQPRRTALLKRRGSRRTRRQKIRKNSATA
jgi:hypothetical protein